MDFGAEEIEEEKVEEMMMEGVASIALLACGSISGHFIQLPHSICYGLSGTELACERECSRGEDYRLIKLTITDFNTKKEQATVVECKGHDAARFHSIDHAHGWDKDITGLIEQKDGKKRISVSFECETLKAEKAAEDHIRKFMPKLAGLDAVDYRGEISILIGEHQLTPVELHLSFILYYSGPICHPLHPQCVLFDGLNNNAVNIGKMTISGLDFGADEGEETE